MAQPLTTSPKARWGIPLVLPHVLLSVALLLFVFASEQPVPSNGAPGIASVTNSVAATGSPRLTRGS